MKKLFSMLVLFVLFSCVTSSVYAAYAHVASFVSTAAVTFSGTGSVQASIQICNILDGSTTGQIWWNTGNITPGQTVWQRADAYIVVYSTITAANGAMQIYTDNTNGVLPYKYVGVSTTTAAGLVGYSSTYPNVSSTTLSMCWRILSTTSSVTTGGGAVVPPTTFSIQQGATGYPSRLWDATGTGGNGYPCWHWIEDKMNQTTAINGTDYVIIKDAVRGIQGAEYTWFANCPSPNYVYFGANFSSALSGVSYGTDTLTIETFTE
jgi:hypothetical protein